MFSMCAIAVTLSYYTSLQKKIAEKYYKNMHWLLSSPTSKCCYRCEWAIITCTWL